jgi:NADPH-dependent 2,4-dienoyl-CoA reductase/sulfur reductase-like enzyme
LTVVSESGTVLRRRQGRRRVVVVGGGRAGVAAVEELRRLGYDDDLVVLHDEPTPPYDRPACAKGLLTGHKRPADALMRVHGADGVDWRFGRRAMALDAQAQVVHTDTGERFGYDRLVIATGAAPLPPQGWPMQEPGLHVLYRLGDAWRLRRELRDARRVAVVGAGLTGCEVAHAVRSLARECVLIDPRPQALVRPLGEQVGRVVTREIARDGVTLRLSRRVTGLARGRRGWVLMLDDGDEVHADVVVTTTGERPDTTWLAGVPGVDLSDGILCDEALRVVGLPGVVAAGTAARWPNLRYSATPRRVGQWITALEQGRAAARTLMTGSAAPAFTHVPRFWSDQFGLRIQVCGVLPGDAEVTLTEQRPGARRPARAGLAVGYHQDGDLVGLVAVNAPQAFTAITRTMLAASGPRVSPVPILPALPAPVAAPVPLPVPQGAEAPAARRAITPAPAAPVGDAADPDAGGDSDERDELAPVTELRGRRRAGLPAPAGPPPISGPLPIGPRLFAVR